MTEEFRAPLSLAEGFWPTAGETGDDRIPNSARDGLNLLWIAPGNRRSAKGLGAGPSSAGGERLYLLDKGDETLIGSIVEGKGSIIPYRGNSEWYVTENSNSGNIHGTVDHDGTGKRLRYYVGGQEFNAGLSAPVLENPALSEGGASLINFTTAALAFQLTRIRTTAFMDGGSEMSTLAESNGSQGSNVIAVTNKKVKLKFPAAGTGLDAHDAWGVYVTPINLGSVGPYVYLKTVRENQIPGDRLFELEWQDSELSATEQPPIGNNPPPDGEFVVNIGNVMCVLNTRGGGMYAPSKPGFPEHYSALAEAQYSPPTRIVGCTMRPSDGELIAWGDNAIFSLQLTGNPDAPILARAILSDKGVSSPHGCCFADNELYCFNGENGPYMLDGVGNPSEGFALPVRDYIKDLGWDQTKVAVGHHPALDAVVFCHGPSDRALIYMRGYSRAIGKPIWCVPYRLNANEDQNASVATVLFMGKLVIGRGDGLFYFEAGGANPTAFVVSAKQDGAEQGINPMDRKTILGYIIHGTFEEMVSKVFFDDADPSGDDEESFRLEDDRTGTHYTKWKNSNKHCKNWTIRIELQNSDEKIDDIQFRGFYEPNIRANT